MASENIIELTEDNFDSTLADQSLLMVDFWASWCGPCKAVAPLLEELADEYQGRLRIAKLNVEQHRELSAQFQVMGLPTFLLFKGGEIVDQMRGAMPRAAFERFIEKHLDAVPAPAAAAAAAADAAIAAAEAATAAAAAVSAAKTAAEAAEAAAVAAEAAAVAAEAAAVAAAAVAAEAETVVAAAAEDDGEPAEAEAAAAEAANAEDEGEPADVQLAEREPVAADAAAG